MQLLFIINELFYFYEEKQLIKIFFNGKIIYQINKDEKKDYKSHVIFLCNIGMRYRKIGEILNIDQRTVKKWYTTYLEKGLNGLDEIKDGAPGYGKEIEAYIVAKFKELNFVKNYKEIICEGIKTNFNKKIHWRTVTEILKRNGIDLSKHKCNKKIEIESKGKEDEQCYSENTGLCFLYPYLEKLNIKDIFSKAIESFNSRYYSVLDYIYGLFLLLASNRIEVEEQIKMVEDRDHNLILGENGLPSLRNYRKYIPQIIEKIKIEELQMELAKQYYKERKGNEIYIDGHFLPYNGKYNTFKGYNPIRRFAQKGRTAYFLNNSNGRPFFYILSDGYKDFREYLKEISLNLDNIVYTKDKKHILLIFDRGGWGEQFCEDLSNDINFICWRTGKCDDLKECIWQKMQLQIKANGYNQYECIDVETTEIIRQDDSVKRYIYIKRGEKISLAFSNDNKRTLKELVTALTKRWGLQENVFKPLKKIGIDKISSYKYEEYPENWLMEENQQREVNNPEIIIITERIKETKKQINKEKQKLGNLTLRAKRTRSKKRELIKDTINGLKNELKKQNEELENCISTIPIQDFIKDKNIVRLNNEKKIFFDLIKVLSYNVQQDLVDDIRPFYNNERDVNMFARQILRRPGEIKINKESLFVKIKSFRSKRKHKVMLNLIKKLNINNIMHPILNKKIVFELH